MPDVYLQNTGNTILISLIKLSSHLSWQIQQPRGWSKSMLLLLDVTEYRLGELQSGSLY